MIEQAPPTSQENPMERMMRLAEEHEQRINGLAAAGTAAINADHARYVEREQARIARNQKDIAELIDPEYTKAALRALQTTDKAIQATHRRAGYHS